MELNGPESPWTCPSCEEPCTTRYCGACGERRIVGVAPVVDNRAGTEPGRSFFGRLHSSLCELASPPGRLTADWIRGRRVGYLAPLTLFLWINVAFFVVQSASGFGILTWPLRAHLSDDSIAWLTTRLLAQHRPDMTIPTFDTMFENCTNICMRESGPAVRIRPLKFAAIAVSDSMLRVGYS